jgi:CarD family transcriptional regulator
MASAPQPRLAQAFHVGDKVVYPNHGVGVIEQISQRFLNNRMMQFYELRITSSSLKVTVPITNAQAVGLRPVLKSTEAAAVLSFLCDGIFEDPNADWKFRFKENSEKMRSGSLLDVAAVLKNLLNLHKNKPLSPREKKMVERARYLLASEIAMAKNIDETSADELIVATIEKMHLKFPELTPDA